MGATDVEEQRIMSPILRRLLGLADQVQQQVIRAHALEQPVPGLSRTVARLIGAMRLATAQTVTRGPVSVQDLAPVRDWRIARVRAVAKVIKAEDEPSLGTLVSLAQQARGMAADLTRHVSDALVTEHTKQQQAECRPDEVLIWQPERDACVICLKYAGRFRGPDETFQGGLSFNPDAPKPKSKDRIPGPPAHPRCRCELARIPAASAQVNSVALKREAERSILKGWALPSESDTVRVAAAKQLLASGIKAPKTVLAETRKRLASGQSFTRELPGTG